jgi:hypothetical protein
VVPNLEHVCAQPCTCRGQQSGLLALLGIAHEEDRAATMAHAQDEAVVVWARRRIVLRTRPEDLNHHVTHDAIPAQLPRPQHNGPTRAKRGQELGIATSLRLTLSLSGIPQLVHDHPVQPVNQTAVVIGMRVRQHHGAQPSYPICSQEWGDHAYPHILRTAHKATSVHEQRLAAGELEQRGVALSHVQMRDAQLATVR